MDPIYFYVVLHVLIIMFFLVNTHTRNIVRRRASSFIYKNTT